MTRKIPVCKTCGKEGHYAFQCWNKMRSKPIKSRSKASLKKKVGKVLSKKNERKTVIERLDRTVSRIVRIGNADSRGFCTCYTCGRKLPWSEMDCGHFFKRGHINTRFDLMNVVPQCRVCNRVLNGNYKVFEKKMRKDLTEQEYASLERRAYCSNKPSTMELKILLSALEKYLSNLEQTAL